MVTATLASSSRAATTRPHRPTHRPSHSPAAPADGDSGAPQDTRVSPLIGGGAIFPVAHQMISQAKKSVQLEMYQFENSTVGGEKPVDVPGSAEQQQLMQDLVAAAKRGVDVQVILDDSAEKSGAHNNDAMRQYLTSHGVKVLSYPPNTVNIDHVKLLITDGNKALIGGMNWGNHSPINHDADVLVEGPAARDLQSQVFEPDWQFSGGKLSGKPAPPVNDPKVQALTTSPGAENGGSNTILRAVLDQIQNAKDHAYVEMFTLTHHDVIQAMIDAKQRGVDVRVLLDPSEHSVNQKAFDALKQAGVQVKWFDADAAHHQLLHAKWGEFDNQDLIIGSGNWSLSGLGTQTHEQALDPQGREYRHNHEADVLVKDGGVASAFHNQFEDDWANHASDTVPAAILEAEKHGGWFGRP